MSDANRRAFLQSALHTAETRLKLAVARQRWREAIEHATEAAALDDALKELGSPHVPSQDVGRRVVAQG
jgi:hypothetical protein